MIEIYRKIYEKGVEPKVFINDFLELIYYFKNINSLTIENTNFSLNDEEFKKIKEISNKIDNQVLILFWQFVIKTLEEIDIVSNQNLSIEMLLIRLMYLDTSKLNEQSLTKDVSKKHVNEEKVISEFKKDTIDQIKNVTQEKKNKPELHSEIKAKENISINSFNELLEVCNLKKEMKLKYELEKNVNLVSFEKNRIEISFNDNLDKNFVKELSLKLFEWTKERWIITFSKTKGEISVKQKKQNDKIDLINQAKKSDLYKSIIEKFSDANLVEVKIKKDENK